VKIERRAIDEVAAPFPVYPRLAGELLAAGAAPDADGAATVAHGLGALAAYAYADTATVAMVMGRLGLAGGGCVRIEQAVDAMFVFSTAYLVQSRCGRVVLLGYRGTEPTNLANWLGDADVGPEEMPVGNARLPVHAGFRRNMRATRWSVLEELAHALAGRSLADPERPVPHPLEALLIGGHSLGGAMAVLFALSLAGRPEHRALVDRLRALHTFGQPLATAGELPAEAREVEARIVRHVRPRDLIPALPAASWGRFTHIGREVRWEAGAWRPSAVPVRQLASIREVPRSLLALFGTARSRDAARYSLVEHGPHHYLAALRPPGRVSELGDFD